MATTKDNINVLHVDDEPDLTKLVADFLEREDERITVDTATSAIEGLDLLREGHYDCVISDYAMPGQNGIEFLETLREEFPNIPFILYTGKGSEEVASDAISTGATDYLQKKSGTEQYELLANRILNAVEQYHSRKRAAELERIRTLINDINQAIVRADSRAEVESRVCEIISGSDPYLFAWIGEVDAESDRVVPRESAGIEEGYLEEITLTTKKDGTGGGPTGTAIRERRVAVSQKVAKDPDFTYQQAALERGYRSMAAVPLEYEDSVYGGLNVYADRPDAFDEAEKEVLAELGEDIGHAIHSKEIKADLKRARQRAEKYFETAGNILVVLNRDGTVAQINRRGCEILGYERAELVGSDWLKLTAPDEVENKIEEMLFSFWEDGADPIFKNTNPIKTKDGEKRFLKWHNTAIRDEAGNVTAVLCSGIDITDQERYKKELKQYQAFVENSTDLITLLDANGRIKFNSPAIEDLLGYDQGDLIGEDPFEYIHPDDRNQVRKKLEPLIAESGAIDIAEFRFNHANGSWVWFESRGRNRLDDPNIEGIIISQREVTERKEREQELQREKERLDDFASFVSHDLRNLLNVAKGRINLAQKEFKSENLDIATSNIERAFNLIEDMLRFAREGNQVIETQQIEIGSLVEACWDTVEPDTATLVSDLDIVIEGDQSRVRQLLENLIRNAIEHGGEDVTLRVGSYQDGFFVADDGPGIPEEEREEVWDAGYSETEEGTGLGLAIVKQIVEAHGWNIRVTDSSEGGARFEITGLEDDAA
jgi:PAS domain S-box-containing protein